MVILSPRNASAAWWSAFEVAVRYGAQFVVTVVLARLLAPEVFGMVSMLLVFTSLAAVLIDAGFGAALIQCQRPTADDETTVFAFGVAMSLLLALLLAAAAPMIGGFYRQPALVDLARVTALALPLSALGAVPDAVLTLRLDFRKRSLVEINASLISGVVAIVLALLGAGVWSLAGQAIVAAGLRSLFLWVKSGWRPSGVVNRRSFNSLSSFGGYMLLSALMDTVATRLQSLLIGRMFSSAELGLFSVAQNTQQAPASFIGAVLNRVGFPVFAAASRDPVRLLSGLKAALNLSMFVFFPCMVGISLTAKPLVLLLYGNKWSAAAPMLSILALAASVWPMHVLNLAAISAQGHSNLFFRLELIKKLATIALVVACSTGGTMAMVWASLVSSALSLVINAWYSGVLLDYGIARQLRDQAFTAALTAVAAVPCWMVLHVFGDGAAILFVALVLSAVIYIVLALTLRHSAILDYLSLLNRYRNS